MMERAGPGLAVARVGERGERPDEHGGRRCEREGDRVRQTRRRTVLEMRLHASSAQALLSGPMPAPEGIVRCEELIAGAEGNRRGRP